MKKIFCFIALLAGVMSFTSCSKDDATYKSTPVLEVSSADLYFEAVGGTGSITVSNPTGALTASTETACNWLSLSVSGNSVAVTVSENTTLDGRSATILLKAGDTEARVTATQKGGTYGLTGGTIYNVNDEARTLSVPLVHTASVTLESEVDWISASFDEETDQVKMALKANDTGWRRSGTVILRTGEIEDRITVSQFDFLNDVQGSYGLVYETSQGYVYQPVALSVTSGNEGTLAFVEPSPYAGITIPVTFDPSTFSFSIANFGDLENTVTAGEETYTLCTMVMMTNGTSIYRVRPASLPGLTATLVEEDAGIFFDMTATYGTYQFYGLRIGYGTGGYDGYKGAYVTFPSCYLMKM